MGGHELNHFLPTWHKQESNIPSGHKFFDIAARKIIHFTLSMDPTLTSLYLEAHFFCQTKVMLLFLYLRVNGKQFGLQKHHFPLCLQTLFFFTELEIATEPFIFPLYLPLVCTPNPFFHFHFAFSFKISIRQLGIDGLVGWLLLRSRPCCRASLSQDRQAHGLPIFPVGWA